MNMRRTLILGLLLILVAGYFYIFEFRAAKQKEEIEESLKKIIPFSQEEITEINITKKAETITLKKGKEWVLESPASYKADEGEIKAVIEKLNKAKKDRMIEENPSDLSPYGLKEPQAELLVKNKENKSTRILFGKSNPTGEFLYAKISDSPGVFLINISINNILDKTNYDLRDKSLVDLDTGKVSKIEFLIKGFSSVVVEKNPEDIWDIKKPLTAKGDKTAIENLLVRFKNDKVKQFIDTPQSLSAYGLDRPSRKILFYLKDKKQSKSFIIGKEDGTKKGFFAKREELSTVFLIEKAFVEKLPGSANELRNRTLLAFDRKHVSRIELIREDKEPVVLEKEKDSWNILKPVKTKASDLEIDNVLWLMENIQIKDFADTRKGPDAFGLKKPKKEFRLWLKGKSEPEALLFGSTINKGTYTKLKNRDDIFLLESKIVSILFRPLFNLKERRLVIFKEENIEKIDIRFEDKNLSLKRKKNDWKLLISGKEKKIKETNAKEIIWSLNDLKFTDTPAIKDPSPFNPENQELSVTLFEKGGKELDRLTSSRTSFSENLSMVKVKSKNTVYTVEKSLLEQLRSSIRKMLEPEKQTSPEN